MKVKLNVSRAGTTAEGKPFSQGVGEVIEVSNDEAKALLDAGQAEAVAKKPSQRAEKTEKKPKSKKS